MNQISVILICGGSCSGKSVFACRTIVLMENVHVFNESVQV